MANEAIVDEVPFFEIYLESTNGSGLEPQVSLEVLSDLPDEPLEGQLADEQLGRLLVTPDLTQGDCARPVPMRLLHSSGGGGRLPGGLGGQLLPGGLASGGLTGGLLRTSHVSQSSAKETLVISLNIDHSYKLKGVSPFHHLIMLTLDVSQEV